MFTHFPSLKTFVVFILYNYNVFSIIWVVCFGILLMKRKTTALYKGALQLAIAKCMETQGRATAPLRLVSDPKMEILRATFPTCCSKRIWTCILRIVYLQENKIFRCEWIWKFKLECPLPNSWLTSTTFGSNVLGPIGYLSFMPPAEQTTSSNPGIIL